jgi:hypothetical protein
VKAVFEVPVVEPNVFVETVCAVSLLSTIELI